MNPITLPPPTPHFKYNYTQVRPSDKSSKIYVEIVWVKVSQPWSRVWCFGLPHYETTVVIGGMSSNLQRSKSCLHESSGRKSRGNLSNKPENFLYYPPFIWIENFNIRCLIAYNHIQQLQIWNTNYIQEYVSIPLSAVGKFLYM